MQMKNLYSRYRQPFNPLQETTIPDVSLQKQSIFYPMKKYFPQYENKNVFKNAHYLELNRYQV